LKTGPEDRTDLLPLLIRELQLRLDLSVAKGTEALGLSPTLLKAFALWHHMWPPVIIRSPDEIK
jgi:hypothetical protein